MIITLHKKYLILDYNIELFTVLRIAELLDLEVDNTSIKDKIVVRGRLRKLYIFLKEFSKVSSYTIVIQ